MPGQSGALAPLGNQADFVRQAERLAGNLSALREMGKHARQTAVDVSWDRIIGSIESIYQSLICGTPLPDGNGVEDSSERSPQLA